MAGLSPWGFELDWNSNLHEFSLCEWDLVTPSATAGGFILDF